MKRLFSVLLTLSLLLSLTACGGKDSDTAPEKPEPDQTQEDPVPEKVPEEAPESLVTPLRLMKGPIYYGEYDDNYNLLISSVCEDIFLADDYPELANALYELNTSQSEGAYGFMQDWLPDAQGFMEDNPDFFGGFTYESTYTVQRADSLILSIREDAGSYTGGVHGNYGVLSWNFDTASGTQLELEDVLTDTTCLAEVLTEKIRAKYDFEPFDSLDEMLAEYLPENYTWTLGYQGITFYFSPYEIASYAAGLLTATIWFDEMPELFREEYMAVPEGGYAVALPNYYDVDVDLNPADSARDVLSVWEQANEYDSKHLVISLNGQEFVDESWSAYYITPYLVCVDDAFYLIAEGSSDNDYCTVYIYSLSNGAPNLTAELSGTGFVSHWYPEAGYDGIYYTETLNNPQEIQLGSRCNLLGTKTAYRSYRFAPGGALIPLTEEFELSGEYLSITSSIPLDVTLLPQNTVKTIPADTEFSFLRTDNETWVDLVMADGQECRIVLETADWPATINGISEFECFRNLMYAG